MSNEETRILDKYTKHCIIGNQKFSEKERKILNNVFQRAMEKLAGERFKDFEQAVRGECATK